MEIEQVRTTALFYDSYSARPAPVQVQLYNGHVHLHDPYDDRFIQSFSLAGATTNRTGPNFFLYLDPNGLTYLQLDHTHPLVSRLELEQRKANTGWVYRLLQQKIWVLVPLLMVLVVGLYFLLLNLVPFLGLRLIGRQSEITLGNHLHEVMMQEVGLLSGKPDTAGTYQLQAFAWRLQLSTEYPIRITLVHSPVVNAYALPGGQVVVYTGLLKKLTSPEALAALLAHETTHVNERHSLRSLLRSSANGLLVSIVLGDATGITGALAGNLENLSGLRYSRSLESEADQKGMDLMRANSISPKGMVQLMKMLEQQGDIPDQLSFLSSHPLTKERIKAAEAYCRKYPQNTKRHQELTPIFNRLQQTIKYTGNR